MKTSRLQNDGKWAEALNTYDDATDRLPNSAILKDGLARLHREQTKELDRLELKRLLGYSNWLKQVIPIFDDIVRVDPRNSDAKSRRNKIHNEAESLADELTQYGNRAMANDQLERAEQLLNLAGELSDAPAIKESLKNLKQQKIVTARYQKALALKQRHITDKLIKQFNESYRKRNFEQAREHLNALAGTAYSRDRLATLENKLQRALDQEAARLVREGMNAYSRGQYEAAVNNWKQVLVLQPSNKQARESLKRAERVLKNLEDIRSKQGGE